MCILILVFHWNYSRRMLQQRSRGCCGSAICTGVLRSVIFTVNIFSGKWSGLLYLRAPLINITCLLQGQARSLMHQTRLQRHSVRCLKCNAADVGSIFIRFPPIFSVWNRSEHPCFPEALQIQIFFGGTARGIALFTSSGPVLNEFGGLQVCSLVCKGPPEVRGEEVVRGAQLQKAHPAPELPSTHWLLLELFPLRGAKCLRRRKSHLLNYLP